MRRFWDWGGLISLGLFVFCLDSAFSEPALPYHSLEEFDASLSQAVESGSLDPFWQTIVEAHQMPLAFDDTAVFLYRGAASSVAWCVDFAPGAYWLTYMSGDRIAETDLWMLRYRFPVDARLSYRIRIDGDKKLLLDPLNPFRNMEGSGPVSELRMPQYRPPTATISRGGAVAKGVLSQETAIRSAVRGYTVNYQVYTPAGYSKMGRLPSLYVVDGQEYAREDLGGMVNVLDNLIADGTIEPLIVVFIDQRDLTKVINRRNDEFTSPAYEKFLVSELVPTIDSAYRTDPQPHRRALLGDSLGGLFVLRVGVSHSDLFGMIAMQSPAPALESRDYALEERQDRLPLQFFLSVGTIGDIDLPAGILRNILTEKGYPLRYLEVSDGHSWGHYRSTLDDLLVYFFALQAQGPGEMGS